MTDPLLDALDALAAHATTQATRAQELEANLDGLNAQYQRLVKDDQELYEAVQDAREHLACYLDRQGLSIDAVRLTDPDLEALRRLLEDAE